MQEALPVYVDELDALRDAIAHCGGYKAVALALWPTKTLTTATTNLQNATNSDRRERLDLGECLLILKMAHDAGFHAPARYLNFSIGYELTVVDAEAQEDRMMEQMVRNQEALIASQKMMQTFIDQRRARKK
jgi:hypothetical protein